MHNILKSANLSKTLKLQVIFQQKIATVFSPIQKFQNDIAIVLLILICVVFEILLKVQIHYNSFSRFQSREELRRCID